MMPPHVKMIIKHDMGELFLSLSMSLSILTYRWVCRWSNWYCLVRCFSTILHRQLSLHIHIYVLLCVIYVFKYNTYLFSVTPPLCSTVAEFSYIKWKENTAYNLRKSVVIVKRRHKSIIFSIFLVVNMR